MALNSRRYTVDQVQGPLARPDRAGRIRQVYRITFTVGERHVGNVEIPAEQFATKESALAAATQAIEAEVAKISAIYSLGST
jgi:hypothetical protein